MILRTRSVKEIGIRCPQRYTVDDYGFCEPYLCPAWKQLSETHGFCGISGEPTSYELQQFMEENKGEKN